MSNTNNSVKSFEDNFIAGFLKERKLNKSYEEEFISGLTINTRKEVESK